MDTVRLTGKLAFAERPPCRPTRLHREHVVRGKQERVLLHGDERRHETVQACDSRIRHVFVPARLQQFARLRGKQPSTVLGKELQRLLEVAYRLAKARTDSLSRFLQLSEIVPFKQHATLACHSVGELAQDAAVPRVRKRVEIRLHAVAHTQRQHGRRGDCQAYQDGPTCREPSRSQGGLHW